ncbi:ATP-binding protein [Bradyrhizobium sp. 145]|uniref:sensor histidine kinase n=1 Tax=Bradyrhizobium sp. 145 TaxID=2782621 RepID=UPI001FFBB29A|nr:ATP-binding protein [Bradyrhizobium sp. 145]
MIGFKTPSFGLSHQFVVASAVTIAISMGLLAFAISHRIEVSMMQTAAEEGALFTEVFLGPSAQDLATSRSLSPASVKKLDDLLVGKLGERVKLIKIWLPDATLVYSTNKEAIGERFPSNHIATAAAGKANSEFEFPNAVENVTETGLNAPLVEIYAPLFYNGTAKVIAVSEVYTDGRRLADDLASIRIISMGIVGAVTAPMMLVLFLMVRRASNLVTDYQSTLMHNLVEAQKLAAQNKRLRSVADDARLEAANSNENLLARIGQDLHDGPIQLLSLLMLKLTDPSGKKRAENHCGGPSEIGPEALTARIMDELRHISTGLVLPQLEGLTPNEILRLAAQNHENATGTRVSTRIDKLPEDLASPLTICLYRIVQEGLNNAFHHGGAVEQRVEISVDADSILIAVSDSGPGLLENNRDNQRSRIGLGIAGLRNRVEALKGTFQLISRSGSGTQIQARLPVTRTRN